MTGRLRESQPGRAARHLPHARLRRGRQALFRAVSRFGARVDLGAFTPGAAEPRPHPGAAGAGRAGSQWGGPGERLCVGG